MIKKVFFGLLLFLIGFSLKAQDTIKGQMKPVKDHSWVILYQLKGVHQQYIANATIDNGKFELVIPKGKESGMYRILYDNKKNLYLDFIYNHENINVLFHPDYPSVLAKYKTSVENKLYQKYLDSISDKFNALDSVQVEYFKIKDTNLEATLNEFYHKKLDEVKTTQKTFETNSKGKLALHFIKANNRYYAKNLIKGTNQYMDTLRTHYFDYIDFNDSVLEHSSFFMDRIIDYITYLHTSSDAKKTDELQKRAIADVLKIIDKITLKKDIIESLMFMYAQQENKEIVDYLSENYYNKLPVSLQDAEFKLLIKDFFKTTIGQLAPEISWDVYGKKYDLYKLPKNDYYIVLFWSSTCSHCMKEVPKFNAFLKDKKNITTVAVGLEDDESKANWKELTFDFDNIKYHVLGLGKWQNKYSRDYGITGTPSYFILDKDKKIIAKPYDLDAIKAFFKDKKEN
jgi:thiol-disulfide isomerase/thioredoxin